jgi:hypothetical protein
VLRGCARCLDEELIEMSVNEKPSSALRVACGKSPAEATCSVEVNGYVPLRLRTYAEPIGAGYVHLGNHSTTLMELAVQPRVQVVRGLTVTSIDRLSPWPRFSVALTSKGLPVVSTHFDGGEIVDLDSEFEISARPGEIVVFWGKRGACKAYVFGKTRFLTRDRTLVGVWFTGLTEEETASFCSHVQRQG